MWSCRPSVYGAVWVLASCCWFHVGQSFASSSLLINLVSGGSLFSDISTQSCPFQGWHARVLMPACVALNSELGGGLVPVSAGARVSSAQSQTQNLNAKLR